MLTWRAIGSVLVALIMAGAACSSDTEGSTADSDAAEPSAPDAEPTDCTAPRPSAAGTERRSFDDDGTAREYDLSVPSTYDGSTPAPLVLNLHGFSSNATQQSALTDMPDAAGERGFVVVTPQALPVDVPLTTGTITTTFWNLDPAAVRPGFEPVDDLGFLDGLLSSLDEELCLDPDRWYVTGMSNGAGMTMALICGEKTRFVVPAAPVAGVNLVGDCRPGESIPTMAVHGDADPLIPYDGGLVVGQDYEVIGVDDRMNALAVAAGCEGEPTVETPFEDIELRTWPDCPDGTDISLTTVIDGGHTWPGAEIDPPGPTDAPPGQEEFVEAFDFSGVAGHQTPNIDTTELVLDFFEQHPGAE